ncbi:MAG: hypothetical protein OXH93_06785 [Caldilineaceae bacterium]|nr:hypothetical protein [Caldilineaceae bacterium]
MSKNAKRWLGAGAVLLAMLLTLIFLFGPSFEPRSIPTRQAQAIPSPTFTAQPAPTTPTPVPTTPVPVDRNALIALYNATGGANWVNNENWLSAAPLEEWHGVATDDSGHVAELDLSENGLHGEIPAELGNLTNLTRLDLAWNQLRGAIPSELGHLTNLKKLDLAWNQFSGSLPPELGHLANLTELYLSDSGLRGCVPKKVWRNIANENRSVGLLPCSE